MTMRILHHTLLAVSLLGLSALALAAAPLNSTWQAKAKSVCDQLQTAMTAYQGNDLQQAHLNTVMAYFQNYDLNIEPAARQAFDQGHIFDIEQRFSTLNKSIVANPTSAQLMDAKQQAQTLCQIVSNDAEKMDATHVTTPKAEA